MRRALAVFLLLAVAAPSSAAEVAVQVLEGKLQIRIGSLDYPDTLQRELTSGLTNRLHLRLSVADGRSVLAQKIVTIAIRYDLWDERFTLLMQAEGEPETSRFVATLPDVNALLASLTLPRSFDAAPLPSSTDLVVRVEALLNPIDREKMRMIRKWVAQNSTPQLGGDPGITVSNAIFNRIFEQYADGSAVAAVWRATAESAPFRIDGTRREAR